MSDAPATIETPSMAASPVDVEAAKSDYRFLKLLAVLSLIVGSASAFTLNLVDPDLWGHVAYGRELLEEGYLPRTATHTFTAEGYRWVNHENLAEITFALGFDTLGVQGMLVAKCLLGLAVLGAMAFVARRHGVRSLAAWVFLLLIANNLKAFFVMRPQLLSFACCAVMLVLLEFAFAKWRKREAVEGPECRVRWWWLAAVPLLLVVWVNSHGAFVAGYCILGTLLAGRIVEAVLVDQKRSVPTAVGLTVVGLVALAMLLVNPYGTGLVGWLVESLRSPRPEITEWAAPKVSDPVFWPFVTLLAVNLAAWAFSDRRRDWTQAVILSLVAWQACVHLRHIAFFALLSGFWTPPHLQSVLARLRSRAAAGLPVTQIGPAMKWAAAGAFGLAIIAQSIGIGDRLGRLPVLRSMYPVDAFDFMAANKVEGRLVVSFNWAQFALAAFPESTVSFDGRFRTCYPQEVVDMNFDFLLGWNAPIARNEDGSIKRDADGEPTWEFRRRYRSPESGEALNPTRVLEHGDPEVVVVDRNYWHPVHVMKKTAAAADSAWTLLYQDKVAQVYGRKRVFDDPASDRYVTPASRPISDAPRLTAVQWPALPLRPGDAVEAEAPTAVAKGAANPDQGES